LQQFLRRHRCGHSATLLVALCAGCAQLPPRPNAQPAAGTVAQAVTVRDRRGVVPPAVEDRVIASLKAEGDGQLAERHLRVLAAQGESDLYRGNAARLLVDGPATFAAMKAAIERARGRVLLESYIVDDGKMADELAALLSRKAAQGVHIAFMYDGLGSIATDPAYFDRLAASGVALCKFNPVNPLERPGYWDINHRDHRKVLVVDQDVAFTGGINISRVYASGSFGRGHAPTDPLKDGWRDTQIELRGPVVQAFASGFERVWASQRCAVRPARALPAAKAVAGERVVEVLESNPEDRENRIYTTLLAAIDAAQRRIELTMAYFAPGSDMIDALAAAARRGVDVTLVLPGRSDFTLVLHAGRAYYDELLDAGVHIHEMDDAVMHAKTAVIDGVWSTVGSSNMDWRSFVANHEVNAIIIGREFGEALEAQFRLDLARSRPVDSVTWHQRGWGQRVMEQVGRLAERLL
jgi:cardiolipin synthase